MQKTSIQQFQCPSDPVYGLRKRVRQTRTFWLNRAKSSQLQPHVTPVQWAWFQTISYLATALALTPKKENHLHFEIWMSRIWDPANINLYWQQTLHRYPFILESVAHSDYEIFDTQISNQISKSSPAQDPLAKSIQTPSNNSDIPVTTQPAQALDPQPNIVTHKVIHNSEPPSQFRIELLNQQEVRELSSIWNDLNTRIWGDPALLGWIKQFFHLEELDQAIRRGKAMKPEDLPVATQLFTPRWIARFLAENTLLQFWTQRGFEVPSTLQTHPWRPENFHDTQISNAQSDTPPHPLKPAIIRNLIRDTQFEETPESKFDPQTHPSCETSKIFDTQISAGISSPIQTLLQAQVCDPACGAGHLLIEIFDVWLELARSIIRNNEQLFYLASNWLSTNCVGLDIDPGVTWIAKWGLARKLELEFSDLGEDPTLPRALNPCIHQIKAPRCSETLLRWQESQFASELGSLLRPPSEVVAQFKPDSAYPLTQKRSEGPDVWIEILNRKFDVVISNPPYMQNRSLPSALKKLAKERVPIGKTDLFALFLDQGLHLLHPNGQIGLLTMQSWMFLKSFSQIRQKLMTETKVCQLAHIGPGAFEDLGAFNALTAAFTATKRNSQGSVTSLPANEPTVFYELNRSPDTQEKWNDFYRSEKRHELDLTTFLELPDQRWLYQLPAQAIQNFRQQTKLGEIARPRQGLATTDNQRFVRRWFEIPKSQIGFGFPSAEAARKSGLQWFPYNKGGKFRRWYGVNEFVVHYENDGQVLIDLARKKYPRISDPEFVIKNRPWYFREGIVWSLFGFERFSVRYKEPGFIFDVSGASAFPEKNDLFWVLAYLSSNVAMYYLKALAPTVNFQVGDLASIPCFPPKPAGLSLVTGAAQKCIQLCRTEWNERQVSWDYDPGDSWTERFDHPTLQQAWENRSAEITRRRERLRHEESLIHNEFIQLHRLEKHVSPATPESDLSLPSPEVREACRETLSRILLEIGGSPPWDSLDSFQLSKCAPLWTLHLPNREYPQNFRLPEILSRREVMSAIHHWIRASWPHRSLDECLEFLAQVSPASVNNRSPDVRIGSWLKSQWAGYHSSCFSKCPPLWSIQSRPAKYLQILIPYWNITKETLSLTLNDLILPLISSIKKQPFTHSSRILTELEDFRARIEHCADSLPRLRWTDGITSNLQQFERLFGAVL